jgi:hypothetical protein
MEDRLRVLENRMLRRIRNVRGKSRDEMSGCSRKLHNEKLHNLYSSPFTKSRKMIWTGNVARMERKEMHINYLWESQKERDQWEDQNVGVWGNIKMDLEKIEWGAVGWIGLVRDRNQWRALVNAVMNHRIT